jgi:hypothetical protein
MSFKLGLHFHRWPDPRGGVLSPPPTNLRYTAVRLHDGGVSWHVLNPAEGVYNWTLLDKILRAHPPGTFFVWTLHGTPAHALVRPEEAKILDAYGTPGGGGAARPLAVQTFVTAMMLHLDSSFPNTIGAIETGNEPNYDRVCRANSFFWGTAAEQVSMAMACKMAVTALNRKVEIWSPGFQCGAPEITAFLDAQSHLMLHGKDIIDALCWHPYSYELLSGDDSILVGRASIRSMRALMASRGIGAKKLYITEYGVDGWPSPRLLNFNQQLPSYRYKYWAGLLLALIRDGGLDGIFLYSYDNGMRPCGTFFNDPEGTSKAFNDIAHMLP